MVSSTEGSSTSTAEKRRASAESRSILRYSASVVAPMTRSSPRASIGLRMLAASMAPSALPAPITVCSSSMNRIVRSSASSRALFRRCSNWPRYWAPASMPDRSSATMRDGLRLSGTSPSWMRRASPSAMAGLPTPASPISTALFLRRRARISTVCSISRARPITGSMRPAAASAVRSRPNSSSPPDFADCLVWPCVTSAAQVSHSSAARRCGPAAKIIRTVPGRSPQTAQGGKGRVFSGNCCLQRSQCGPLRLASSCTRNVMPDTVLVAPPAMSAYTRKNLLEADDSSPDGLDMEARFGRKHIDSQQLGVSYFRYGPGVPPPYGHRHREQEAAYVVVSGSGRLKLDDEVIEIGQWDLIRVAPEVARGFEGGPDGLVIVAVGGTKPEGGDGELVRDFWPEEVR